MEVAQHVDKVRINPGLFVFDKPDPNREEFSEEEFAAIGARIRETFEPLVTLLRDQNKALRIGVNHGSLAERMLFTYGDTPKGMVESAMEFVCICDARPTTSIDEEQGAGDAGGRYGDTMTRRFQSPST